MFGGGAEDAPEIQPLTPDLARTLRLPWTSRFTTSVLVAHLRRSPGYGWMAPASGEYLIAEPWRHRDDIASLLEMHARRARAGLVRRALTDLGAVGAQLLLVPESEWAGHTRFYEEQGFRHLERVVYYQLLGLTTAPAEGVGPGRRPLPSLELAPLAAPNFDSVVAIDHAAFPWLWWNSAAEFRSYQAQPNVQIWLGRAASRPVVYAGFTTLDRWGHLDRIAVDPACHGQGYGAAMLAYVLNRMAALGVNRVTLSTQETNTQSQHLYEGFGFRRTAEANEIYGREVESRQSQVESG
jgi:ribosomal protein S18 acetylase RimI-like enzyme